MASTDFAQLPLAVSVDEAARLLGIGRSTVYVLMTDGTLRFRKIGRRRVIATADLVALLEKH